MGDMTGIELIYWGATIVGGTLFILRTIMMVVGLEFGHDDYHTPVEGDFHGDIHHDIDADHDIHLDADHADHVDHADQADGHADSDISFRLLSLQGLTAFFMMFGLVGLALLKANMHVISTLVGGGAAGFFSVQLIGLIFEQARHLQSEGTLNIENAIGQAGSVYLTIPGQGTGQVQITVQGTRRILDASSMGEQVIKTGEKVRVTGIMYGSTLVVERIESR